jgi:hypothetical protein
MFKCTSAGVIEFGGINHLTPEDIQCIADDIAERTSMPTLRKVNGVWQQRSSLDILDYGYRIHEPEEEESTIAQLNSDLDDLAVYKQLAGVTEGV